MYVLFTFFLKDYDANPHLGIYEQFTKMYGQIESNQSANVIVESIDKLLVIIFSSSSLLNFCKLITFE